MSFNAFATPGLAKNAPSAKGLVAATAAPSFVILSFLTPLPASTTSLLFGSITFGSALKTCMLKFGTKIRRLPGTWILIYLATLPWQSL